MNLRTLLDRLDAIDHKSTLKEEWQPNPRQKDWLGNADASDPYIINRMPDALGPKPEKDSKGLPQSGNTTSSRSERRRDSDSAPAGAEIRSRPTRLAANDPRRTNYQVIGGKIPAGDNIPDDADDEWDGRVFYGDATAIHTFLTQNFQSGVAIGIVTHRAYHRHLCAQTRRGHGLV